MADMYTFNAMLLLDLDLQGSYKAIDSVTTGRIHSLVCVNKYKAFFKHFSKLMAE